MLHIKVHRLEKFKRVKPGDVELYEDETIYLGHKTYTGGYIET